MMKYKIVDIKEVTKREHISGFGDKALFKDISSGFKVFCDGNFSIFISEKPNFNVGDFITFGIERNEIPSV